MLLKPSIHPSSRPSAANLPMRRITLDGDAISRVAFSPLINSPPKPLAAFLTLALLLSMPFKSPATASNPAWFNLVTILRLSLAIVSSNATIPACAAARYKRLTCSGSSVSSFCLKVRGLVELSPAGGRPCSSYFTLITIGVATALLKVARLLLRKPRRLDAASI